VSDFSELYAVSAEQALLFFARSLEKEVRDEVTKPEVIYVASVLGHYAQTPRGDSEWMVPSGSLFEVLDNFVLPGLSAEGSAGIQDPMILETAGSHVLLLAGFFRSQMKRTHNLGWYDQLGSSFFNKASRALPQGDKALVLGRVSRNFALLTQACHVMSRRLHEERFVLKLD